MKAKNKTAAAIRTLVAMACCALCGTACTVKVHPHNEVPPECKEAIYYVLNQNIWPYEAVDAISLRTENSVVHLRNGKEFEIKFEGRMDDIVNVKLHFDSTENKMVIERQTRQLYLGDHLGCSNYERPIDICITSPIFHDIRLQRHALMTLVNDNELNAPELKVSTRTNSVICLQNLKCKNLEVDITEGTKLDMKGLDVENEMVLNTEMGWTFAKDSVEDYVKEEKSTNGNKDGHIRLQGVVGGMRCNMGAMFQDVCYDLKGRSDTAKIVTIKKLRRPTENRYVEVKGHNDTTYVMDNEKNVMMVKGSETAQEGPLPPFIYRHETLTLSTGETDAETYTY